LLWGREFRNERPASSYIGWPSPGEFELQRPGSPRAGGAPSKAFGHLRSSAKGHNLANLDVNPVCRGIAMQGELEAGLQQTSFQECVKSEQAVREQIKKEWSTFTTADKTHCVALAKTGGEASYTELISCMEMARDVRELHKKLTA
jgi:hypothetical protein